MARPARPSLGEFIRRQRELHELSMRQLSDMVGISNPYLSQIEHGLRDPSDRVLKAIARSLKVPTDKLYEQAGRSADEDEPPVVKAIRADPKLSARQRDALLEVYRGFVAR
jgi:transcriptional regulator with XRE-family HTH domain